MNPRCLRADGILVPALLDGILALMKLDDFVDSPVIMMAPARGDVADPAVERSFRAVIDRRWPRTPPTQFLDRFAFYERSRKASAVVMTGETAKYGNAILKKGVIPA
jgi:L-fucose mutarotase